MTNFACGTSRIVGCRFSLYVMSDRFVDIILGALKEVDSSKVWMKTDDVSTCIRGKEAHVFDVAKAIFIQAAKTGVHVVFNGTFSIGCPGDSEGDVYMSEDDERMNEASTKEVSLDTACQFALYPMNRDDYMEIIADQVEMAKAKGTFTSGIHYATRLDGNVHDVFHTLEQAFQQSQKTERSHVVMTAVVSANSPTKKDHGMRKGPYDEKK